MDTRIVINKLAGTINPSSSADPLYRTSAIRRALMAGTNPMQARMQDGSGERIYRYSYEDVDRHGNVRVYFRRLGYPKIRLREHPGTPEFEAEYQRAFAGKVVKPAQKGVHLKGSMGWLCEQYYAAPKFKSLDAGTRKQRHRFLDAICLKAGNSPYAAMRPSDVVKFRDEKAETPDVANAIVQAIRSVFAWACEPEYALAVSNPAIGIKKLAPHNPDGYEPWTEADIAKFCEVHAHGTRERLALDLAIYTGCRRADIIRLGPPMEDNEHLVFVEHKGRSKRGRKEHRLPILPVLRASIDATSTGIHTYLVNSRGEPFQEATFGLFFRTACRAAGIDKSIHGVRKLSAEQCALNGATTNQLMAMFGWRTGSMAEHYTRKADRLRLEADGARLRLAT
jgi:integrase